MNNNCLREKILSKHSKRSFFILKDLKISAIGTHLWRGKYFKGKVYTYGEQLAVVLDEEKQAVVRRLVLSQLLGIGQTNGGGCGRLMVVPAWRHGRRTVMGRDRAGRR